MNCRNARKLMHEILDGVPADQAQLEEHLGGCEQCRAHWGMLSRTQDALIQCVGRPVENSALERLTASVLTEVGGLDSGRPVVPAPRRWVAFAVAAGLLLAFGAGLGAGRTIWPRALTVTKFVTEREVVKEPVRVEVRVPEERVVVRHVPVVRTRIVYRDRPTPAEGAEESELGEGLHRTPEAGAEPNVELVGVNPVIRREIQLAAVVDHGTGDAKGPEPLAGGQTDVADGGAQATMVAQTRTSTAPPTIGEDRQ